jgi:hypothetical protein
MNYIRHLNAFFSLVRSDQRLTASHVSLYIALFHYWNYNRFNNPFSIYRENIMDLCKLSKNTYYKCLKELHASQYIYHFPASSKFTTVRISIIHLDVPKEVPAPYKQLKLFLNGMETDALGRKIETDTVSNLRQHVPKFETGTVANLRHNVKPNINKQENSVCNTHPQSSKKEDFSSFNPADGNASGGSLSERVPGIIAGDFHLLKGAHVDSDVSEDGRVVARIRRPIIDLPSLIQVESFFQENNYPSCEADKFFHYNQSKSWMLTENFQVRDWQSLAHKWMLNAHSSKAEDSTQSSNHKNHSSDVRGEVQSLFSQYLSGKNISKLILPRHSDELQLTLTEEILNLAKQRRMNQLSGSNERSELDLLHAYTSNENHQLLAKDRSNLISLAKRLATLNHFETFKSQGQTTLFSNEP